MKKELTLIKLGGSVITDKNKAFVAKKEVIDRLSKEIRSSLEKYKGDLIIGHGSGSFGHTVAAKYKTQEGIINEKSIEGFPLVSEAARRINTIVMDIFLKNGLKAVSFSPLSYTYTEDEKPVKVLLEPIKRALEVKLLPVIYGDVIMDKKKGFCIYSGEKSLNILASNLKNSYQTIRIIYCGETDGVYDEKGNTIKSITPNNYESIKRMLGGSGGVDVTGGMIHKVNEALEISEKLQIETKIINVTKKDNLKNAILGKEVVSTTIY